MRKYRYRLSSTNCNSSSIGDCMVCGGKCVEVFHQTEDREYTRPDGAQGYTQHGCNSYFGHKECLESKRR